MDRNALAPFIVGLVAITGACRAERSTFLGIGDLSGGSTAASYAADVSGDGQKVVGHAGGRNVLAPSQGESAVGWTPPRKGATFHPGAPKGIVPLRALARPGNPAESRADAISEDGLVAAGFSTTAPSNRERPVVWRSGVIDELTLPEGDDAGRVIDASFDGSRLVGFSTADPLQDAATALRQAVVWTRFPGGYDALVLPHALHGTSADAAEAHGISRHAGTIVGFVYDTGSTGRAGAAWPCAWKTSAGGSYEIEPLTGPSGTPELGRANGVSADGLVAVGAIGLGSSASAVRWKRASTSVPFGPAELLGMLPGASASTASAASAGAEAIVGTCETDQGGVPFLWDPAHGMRALADVILASGAELPAGWRLESASSVSADASTVVGCSITEHGKREGFVFRGAAQGDPAGWIRGSPQAH